LLFKTVSSAGKVLLHHFSPNSITSICCGSVVDLLYNTNAQQIEVMEFGLYCSLVQTLRHCARPFGPVATQNPPFLPCTYHQW